MPRDIYHRAVVGQSAEVAGPPFSPGRAAGMLASWAPIEGTSNTTWSSGSSYTPLTYSPVVSDRSSAHRLVMVVFGPWPSDRLRPFAWRRRLHDCSYNRSVTVEAVDLFCGAGGLSLGLRAAGVEVVAGVDGTTMPSPPGPPLTLACRRGRGRERGRLATVRRRDPRGRGPALPTLERRGLAPGRGR